MCQITNSPNTGDKQCMNEDNNPRCPPRPSDSPSSTPSKAPSSQPSSTPSNVPSLTPSKAPSSKPSVTASSAPSGQPSDSPSDVPSRQPSDSPSSKPSTTPSESPSMSPTTDLFQCQNVYGQINPNKVAFFGQSCNNNPSSRVYCCTTENTATPTGCACIASSGGGMTCQGVVPSMGAVGTCSVAASF